MKKLSALLCALALCVIPSVMAYTSHCGHGERTVSQVGTILYDTEENGNKEIAYTRLFPSSDIRYPVTLRVSYGNQSDVRSYVSTMWNYPGIQIETSTEHKHSYSVHYDTELWSVPSVEK